MNGLELYRAIRGVAPRSTTIMISEALLKRGISPERLKQVHAPVGLDLGGRSPEEIAVSIMAEIVAFRHGHDGGTLKIDEKQVDRIVAKANGKGKAASKA